MSEWTMKKFLEENDQKFHDEIKKLREEVVFGFYENGFPEYTQGYTNGQHELTSPITAEEANGLVAKIKELEATNKKLNDRITDLGWQLDTTQWGA